MGCQAICGSQNKRNSYDSIDGLKIIIQYPNNQQAPFTYMYYDFKDREQAQIMEIINILTFGNKKANLRPIFEGNFISIYNSQTERYHYFCHHITIDDPNNPYQGRVWVPYINKQKYDWDDLIENNKVINLQHTVLHWKLEKLPEKQYIDFKDKQEQLFIQEENKQNKNSTNNNLQTKLQSAAISQNEINVAVE
ncbi:hypothetical protein PPERSA_08329 [Pseudocohnilembus persalinus]|uniref:Uncharacterized protein n=1 Tax=Pseudocohnilembus persalinus TaxID=266149 RepID=A0A0V0QPF2_PSEPJ|nr:hypothetical protein PPERSA_08329 [Pseudocohnilembus persalinus]|eukprot:KRX04114.1 hypothetical protein PPERSA_08329 [Pseudocohnilembus persalinus]